MFTRRDFREYVAELRSVEETMQKHYADLVDRIEDDALRMRFLALMQSETEHAQGLARLETIALGGTELGQPLLRWTVSRKIVLVVVFLLTCLGGALVLGGVMQTRALTLQRDWFDIRMPLMEALQTIREDSLRQRLDLHLLLKDHGSDQTAHTHAQRIEVVAVRNRTLAAVVDQALTEVGNGNRSPVSDGELESLGRIRTALLVIQNNLQQVALEADSLLQALRLEEPDIPQPLIEQVDNKWTMIEDAAHSALDTAADIRESHRIRMQEERKQFLTGAALLGILGLLGGGLLATALALRLRGHLLQIAEQARLVRESVVTDNIPDAELDVKGSDEAALFAYRWNGMVAAFSDDIRRRKKLEAEVSMNATTDRLTGALNRRKCEETLISETARAQRYKSDLSLLLVDIDLFRHINEAHGSDVGDTVIARIGEMVRSLIRDSDFLFRFGGEEFLVLGPSTDVNGAAILGEKIRALVQRTPIDPVGEVTVSVGVTAYRGGDDVRTLLKRVDDALYAAKEAGRNRVQQA